MVDFPGTDFPLPVINPPPVARRPRVLVVDDDRPLSTMLSLVLRQYDFAVDVANNGEEALRLAKQQTYDVVVLDLQMPVLDGRAVYRELRALGIDWPVMILSAFQSIAVAAELGAQDAMDKPFDPELLVARLHALVRG